MWPHRRQPTRLPHPWDSPGKNTGVGCHFLLQCTKVKSESEVAQSCPTPSNPMDCSLPGSSIHGIFQAGVLEWGAIAFSWPWSPLIVFLSLWIFSIPVTNILVNVIMTLQLALWLPPSFHSGPLPSNFYSAARIVCCKISIWSCPSLIEKVSTASHFEIWSSHLGLQSPYWPSHHQSLQNIL